MTVEAVLASGVADALAALGVELGADEVRLERPARPEHGDFSTNVALAVAKRAGRPPRELAGALAARLGAAGLPHVESVEVAGPGFVNFRLRDTWLHEALRQVVEAGTEGYATPNLGKGERVQVEFVSANPTGPLHVGNGWLGSYGDALARVLERSGWRVAREYYVNDTGGQIRMLGESLLARRRGEAPPEQGYQGEYVTELAAAYTGPEDVVAAGRFASERILENIRTTVERLGIVFDEWYSQASIEESGRVAETIELMRSRGLVYEQDGATWLASSQLGDSRDRVLVKANGDATYLAGDLAYHRDKLLVRGFDRVIDIFGADHHGQVASLLAGVEAMGVSPRPAGGEARPARLDPGAPPVEAGRHLRPPRRARRPPRTGRDAPAVADELDRPADDARSRRGHQAVDGEPRLLRAVRLRPDRVHRAGPCGARAQPPRARRRRPRRAHTPRELALVRALVDLPGAVAEAARERAPYKVTNWVRRLAGEFHGFYHDCRVLGEDIEPGVTQARLWLVEGVRVGLAIGLSLLGVRAPESM